MKRTTAHQVRLIIAVSIGLTALVIGLTALPAMSQGACMVPPDGNVIVNPHFEAGKDGWRFNSDGQANFETTTTNPYECSQSAEVAIQTAGKNVQLYQTGVTLQPSTTYRLSLAARSTTGQDVQLFVHKHGAPYTDYGLPGHTFDLTPDWQTFEVVFTTANFTSTVTDARLRIWMAGTNIPGESYYFDRVTLVPAAAPPPATATDMPTDVPTHTPTSTSTAVPTATATATQTLLPTATATTLLTSTPASTATTESGQKGQCIGSVSGNIVGNPGFEDGAAFWRFNTDGAADFMQTTQNPYDCALSAEVKIHQPGRNVQLYQTGVALQPATTYRLSLAARSTTGQDVQLYLHKHGAPHTNYGLGNYNLDLTPDWKTFQVEFKTSGFSSRVSDGRLRIWLADTDIAGESYYFDLISLVPVGTTPSTATPTSPPAATSTSTATATSTSVATSTATSTATRAVTATATATLVSSATPTATTGSQGQCSGAISGNVVTNPSFEQGTSGWTSFTNGQAQFATTTANPYDCAQAAEFSVQKRGSNVQVFQTGITLQPRTKYRLSLVARSTSGEDVRVYLHDHASPFTDYGLNGINLDLRPEWRVFEIEFTTQNFTSVVRNARLRLSMEKSNEAGVTYYFDKIALVAGGTTPVNPTNTPAPTNTPPPQATKTPVPTTTPPPQATKTPVPTNTPVATNTPKPPSGGGSELLVFDWNKPVTTSNRGFPWDNPPRAAANGNWVSPVNYAAGTFHIRIQVRNIPVNQPGMKMDFCFWQEGTFNGSRYLYETCTPHKVPGVPGTVVTWSAEIPKMWQKNGRSLNWALPRTRGGLAIKNSAGKPVSDYSNWNWNGENPNHWYPMDIRATVVVVEKGKSFSGWNNYIP